MSIAEIKKKVESIIQHSLDGYEAESSKVDFKYRWYDLNDANSQNEFLRDTTAIVNTIGLDGFIIVGYDDKLKRFNKSSFSDCGLKDTSQIQNLIIKKCSNIFTINTYDFMIEGNAISVIHIPPIIDKPVVLLNYKKIKKSGVIKQEEQRIFVRKNSRTFYASKNDLELMFYDRKNLEPDYDYQIDYLNHEIHSNNIFRKQGAQKIPLIHNMIKLSFNIENIGKRNLVIKDTKIEFSASGIDFVLEGIHKVDEYGKKAKIENLVSTIKPEESRLIEVFYSESETRRSINSLRIQTPVKVEFILTNGKKLITNVELQKPA